MSRQNKSLKRSHSLLDVKLNLTGVLSVFALSRSESAQILINFSSHFCFTKSSLRTTLAPR